MEWKIVKFVVGIILMISAGAWAWVVTPEEIRLLVIVIGQFFGIIILFYIGIYFVGNALEEDEKTSKKKPKGSSG